MRSNKVYLLYIQDRDARELITVYKNRATAERAVRGMKLTNKKIEQSLHIKMNSEYFIAEEDVE